MRAKLGHPRPDRLVLHIQCGENDDRHLGHRMRG
jgi:hypothetical protein